MLNRFLMQRSQAFRLFIYATAFVIGMRAVLANEMFAGLALMWSLLTIPLAVGSSWRHGFWRGQTTSAIALTIIALFDPAQLFGPFVLVFAGGLLLSSLAVLAALAFGQGGAEVTSPKSVDDAVVSVAPKIGNADTTAAEVLARFGLNQQGAP